MFNPHSNEDDSDEDYGDYEDHEDSDEKSNETTPDMLKRLAKGVSMKNVNSPLILPIVIALYAAFQPTIAGIWYITCLLIFMFIRSIIFKDNYGDCNYASIFGQTLNPTLFISIFTFWFILLPMIFFKEYNIVSIVIISCYIIVNIVSFRHCYQGMSKLIDFGFATIAGWLSYIVINASYNAMNADKNFLFIQSASSVEKCSMASKQNFKCKVYKNGQLITQTSMNPGYSSGQ
jgi:hypothetical protein